MPQTPQWSLGQNSSACQFFFTFGHHLTKPQGLRKFAPSVVIGLKKQIYTALEAWSSDVWMWKKIACTWVLTQTPLWSLRHFSKKNWAGLLDIDVWTIFAPMILISIVLMCSSSAQMDKRAPRHGGRSRPGRPNSVPCQRVSRTNYSLDPSEW